MREVKKWQGYVSINYFLFIVLTTVWPYEKVLHLRGKRFSLISIIPLIKVKLYFSIVNNTIQNFTNK